MQVGFRHKLSKKNPWRIGSRNREYELVYFVLQYPEWKRRINDINFRTEAGEWDDPTGDEAVEIALCKEKIALVERCLRNAADEDMYGYLLKGVTEGLSFSHLKTYYDIPCGKDRYYDRCHKFYYLLSQEKHSL